MGWFGGWIWGGFGVVWGWFGGGSRVLLPGVLLSGVPLSTPFGAMWPSGASGALYWVVYFQFPKISKTARFSSLEELQC